MGKITLRNHPNEVLNFKLPKLEEDFIKNLEGPYDYVDNDYVEELAIGEKYIYKAILSDNASEATSKNIKWAEQLDNGEVVELETKEGDNVFSNNLGTVELEYIAKKCKALVIYAYIDEPTEAISAKSKVSDKKIIAFFIGGAGDKESFYIQRTPSFIMNTTREYFLETYIEKDKKLKRFYRDVYLGYNEVRGSSDIDKYVTAEIPNKDKTSIYIIGHSLGGWNGGHLSQILTDKGYNVDLLITLDPVGTGSMVTYASDIYWSEPKPKANYWINIATNPSFSDYQMDDFVADSGGQWVVTDGPQINDVCNCNHQNAKEMLDKPLKDTTISARAMLLHQIQLYLSK